MNKKDEQKQVSPEAVVVAALITKRELAKRLNKSTRTIEMWVSKGYLPAIKLGHSTLFCWADVLQHLRDNYTVNAH